jgi:DNA-binding transcriptional MerR regulator
MTPTYTTKEASELTGASKQALRVYTTRYKQFMSPLATPDAGGERRFTEADLKYLAYVYQQTQSSKTHEEVLAALANGALDDFEWEPPKTTQNVTIDGGSVGTALVPIERLVAIQALLQAEREARQRDEDERQRLIDREQQLSARLEDLRQQLGEAQGELKAIKATRRKPPAWWVRIFGGGEL